MRAELAQSHALLEQRVADRTAELERAAEHLRAEVHERKQAEERLTILVQELAHRVKNLLSVFQSITARTLIGARSVEDARESADRAPAVAGSRARAADGDVVDGCRPEGTSCRRRLPASRSGCASRAAVSLSPSGVQTFALIVHELSTNAAKYGALSNANGEVVVDWKLGGNGGGRYMEFSWKEKAARPWSPPARGLRPVADRGNGQQSGSSTGRSISPRRVLLHDAGAARYHPAQPL